MAAALKRDVYNAAKAGDIHRLRTLLEAAPDTSEVVAAIGDDASTPLIAACGGGHTDVVQYLLDGRAANIDQAGPTGLTPLLCAAEEGHMDTVKVLVERGAEINVHTDYCPSTPIIATCLEPHLDILKYLVERGADVEHSDKDGRTCLMEACAYGHYEVVKYLVEQGANVNRRSGTGSTPLHQCMLHRFYVVGCAHFEPKAIKIIRFLFASGATIEKDDDGLTPLVMAAVAGYRGIMDCVIDSGAVDRRQIPDALELLGAHYIYRKRDEATALELWREATAERERGAIPKPSEHEFQTVEQLDAAIADDLAIMWEAMLIGERLLGYGHDDSYIYFSQCGKAYAERGEWQECIALWRYVVNMQQQTVKPLSQAAVNIFNDCTQLFSDMISAGINVEFSDIFYVFSRAVIEIEAGMQLVDTNIHFGDHDGDRLLELTLIMIGLICAIQDQLSDEQVFEFKRTVYTFLKLDPRDINGQSPLHLACHEDCLNWHEMSFPLTAVIDILVELDASMDAIDKRQNTVLHVALRDRESTTAAASSITRLLEAGAHVDVANADRKTPLDLLAEQDKGTMGAHRYQTLQCLAARAIVTNDIPYKGVISKHLEDFVKKH